MAEKPNEAPAGAAPPPQTMSKKEAVKRSLKKLGRGAMPLAIRADVKRRFDIDLTADYAGRLKAEVLGKGPAARKPAAEEQSPAEGGDGNGPAIPLDDILTLKSLVDRVGADRLRTLIGVLSG